MVRKLLFMVFFTMFGVSAFAAISQCVKLNPDTVCTAVTGSKYNVAETTVSCNGQNIELIGTCVSNTGTADSTVRDNLSVSTTQTNNKHCWCMMIRRTGVKWNAQWDVIMRLFITAAVINLLERR